MTVDAAGYRHPEWHRAYCLIVRAMLLQAIGRARASLPEGIPVVAVTVERTGLPVADPLPILGVEVRQTIDLARRLAGGAKRNPTSISPKDQIALRGWVRTADLALAMAEQGAVRKRSRKARPGFSKRAALVRIERAVAAGRLTRGPRGWVGVAGECGHWLDCASATSPEPAAAPEPVTSPPAARPAAGRPQATAALFDVRPAAPPIPVLSPDLTLKEQTWLRMALTKTG